MHAYVHLTCAPLCVILLLNYTSDVNTHLQVLRISHQGRLRHRLDTICGKFSVFSSY